MITLEERLSNLRSNCPKMFNNPTARDGEIWLGDHIVDVVDIQAAVYRGAGLKSVRIGDDIVEIELKITVGLSNTPIKEKLSGYPIFVNLQEYLKALENFEQKNLKSIPNL